MNNLRPVSLTMVRMNCLDKIVLRHLRGLLEEVSPAQVLVSLPVTWNGFLMTLLTTASSILEHHSLAKILFVDSAVYLLPYSAACW